MPSSALPGTFPRLSGEGKSGRRRLLSESAFSSLAFACCCRVLLRRCYGFSLSLLFLCCAGCAVSGAPMQRRSGAGKARRVARRDASQLAVSAGMHCQPTPEPLRAVGGQDARRPLHRGGLLFGYFLLATQEKVARSPEASEKWHGCRAPQERIC